MKRIKLLLNKRTSIFLLLLLMVPYFLFSDLLAQDNYIPKAGYVPDKETAISIAEAVWLPIFGKEIYSERPFIAKLSKDGQVWKVEGTLPEGMLGGTAYAEIRKSDCKILKVIHYK
jgi:hypothetical protein